MNIIVTIDRITVERASIAVDASSNEAAREKALKIADSDFPEGGEVQSIDYEVTAVSTS